MEDPFSALQKALQKIFLLSASRNGKYAIPTIQKLHEAVENYRPNSKNSFINLLAAIEEGLPFIEKRPESFTTIRRSMDILAKKHSMPIIEWNKILSPQHSPRFQFSNHAPQEMDLLVWLTKKSGIPYAHLRADSDRLTDMLVANRANEGFSQKLNNHLKIDQNFLFDLIISSVTNFSKICKTRLNFYLKDEQIAHAIIKHIPNLVLKRVEPYEQVEELVQNLNRILSNGRSVSTLLRNSEARQILVNSIFFQIYESEDFKNRSDGGSSIQSSDKYSDIKPGF